MPIAINNPALTPIACLSFFDRNMIQFFLTCIFSNIVLTPRCFVWIFTISSINDMNIFP